MSSFFRNDKLLRPKQSFFGVQAPSVQLEEPDPAETTLENYLHRSAELRQSEKRPPAQSDFAADLFTGRMNRVAAQQLPSPEGFKEFFARKYTASDLMNDWVMSSMSNNLGKPYTDLRTLAFKEWETLKTQEGLNARHQQDLQVKAAEFDLEVDKELQDRREEALYRNQKLENWDLRNQLLELRIQSADPASKEAAELLKRQETNSKELVDEMFTSPEANQLLGVELNKALGSYTKVLADPERLAQIVEVERAVREAEARRKQKLDPLPINEVLINRAYDELRRTGNPSTVFQMGGGLKPGAVLFNHVLDKAEKGGFYLIDDKTKETINTSLGALDLLNEFKTLADDVSNKPLETDGFEARIKGVGSRIAGLLGEDAAAQVLSDFTGIASRKIVRVLGGEVGQLTNQDATSGQTTLLNVYNTEAEKNLKYNLFRRTVYTTIIRAITKQQAFGKIPKNGVLTVEEFDAQIQKDIAKKGVTQREAIIGILESGFQLK